MAIAVIICWLERANCWYSYLNIIVFYPEILMLIYLWGIEVKSMNLCMFDSKAFSIKVIQCQTEKLKIEQNWPQTTGGLKPIEQ